MLVTGLPPDTEEQEVLRHFHRRYDLRRQQVAYPIYGLDVRGACLLSAVLTGSLVCFLHLIVILGVKQYLKGAWGIGAAGAPVVGLAAGVAACVRRRGTATEG